MLQFLKGLNDYNPESKMIDQELLAKITHVQNPLTKKTLQEEGRFVRAEKQEQNIFVKYKRDQISVEAKRTIEKDIIAALSDLAPKDKIFVLSQSDSPEINNSKSAPTGPSDNKAQLNVGHAKPAPKKDIEGVKHIIAVGSGKGGVGKSTFSVNFAVSLANQGFKVGLLDADIYGPSVPMLMGKRNDKPAADENKKILPLEAFGVKFISFGLFINEDDPVIWRGPMLGGVLNQFLFDVNWGELDYLIVDLPPGTGDVQLSMVQSSRIDAGIIITTPQDIALLDAVKGFNMFKKLNVPMLGIVENMSSFICDSCEKEHQIFGAPISPERLKEIDTVKLGSIPLEQDLRLASDEGTPYMANGEFSDRKVYQNYQVITKKVVDQLVANADNNKKGFLNKIFK